MAESGGPSTSDGKQEIRRAPDKAALPTSSRSDSIQTVSDYEYKVRYNNDSATSLQLGHTRTRSRKLLKLRAQYDHDPTDWWFASTAIPLIAATFAPMANMLSIAALVVPWRNKVITEDPLTIFSEYTTRDDPEWCTDLNKLSLACGFLGNLFLLFNFTQRIRYIVALPVTIVFFYMASGILIGIVVRMDRFDPPTETQVYSQAYWHAVIASILYMLNSMVLMVNMLGYFLGHYPQHFALNDEQRNLILQTMLFFIWLGGGAGVFARTQGWDYPDALYFCDVTILTIGFGDYFAENDVGRGLVFPFSVGGTIILGLMVSSLHKFARELSKEKVIRKHIEQSRVKTLSRAVTMDQLDDKNLELLSKGNAAHFVHPAAGDTDTQRGFDELIKQEQAKRKIAFENADFSSPTTEKALVTDATFPGAIEPPKRNLFGPVRVLTSATVGLRRAVTRNQKQILMLEERDRFNAMRQVQTNVSNFKRYYALIMSIIAFGLLWCLGAMVFWLAERQTQGLTYFQGLYFCYVSLLTIGYGDLSPKSNAGKAFFVVWSLIAVPTMTILVSDLGDTVIGGFKRGILKNDFGLTSSSQKDGRFMSLVRRILPNSVQASSSETKEATLSTTPHRRGDEDAENGGAENGDAESEDVVGGEDIAPKTINELANEEVSEAEMMRKLAFAIRKVADDIKAFPGKRYQYEEWVEFTRLIRFSKLEPIKGQNALKQLDDDEAVDGVVEWDWLDEHSPMASDQGESEWLLDRLCESLLRIFKKGDQPNRLLDHERDRRIVRADLETSPISHPHSKSNENTMEKADASHVTSATQHQDSHVHKSKNAVAQFLQGESDDGSTPKWSKRAHARMAAAEKTIRNRRRSSGSVTKRRVGPFATTASGSGGGFVGRGGSGNVTKTLKARAMYGSDRDKRNGL